MRKIKNFVRTLIGIRNDTDFYSQGGEDAIASKIFGFVVPVDKGFYVDIGAYHPFKHSNTYLLYKAGWSGINIDPRPGSKVLFDKYRPRDINIEAGVAGKEGTLTYYVINDDSTMNSFSWANLEKLGITDQIKRTIKVPVYPLSTLINAHSEIDHIDFLNIDAEGFETEILEGLIDSVIKPFVISIEQNGNCSLQDVLNSETYHLLASMGYTPIAKNIILRDVSTVFYIQSFCL